MSKTDIDIERYSLHKFRHPVRFPFSATKYSRFKYGDKAAARDFGYELAEGFINTHLSINPIDNQIVVISSPYCFIPTATFAMKDYFVHRLNQHLVQIGLPVVQETKVHREVTYKDDYGALSAEERMNLISNDRFYIDPAFLMGKTPIFMDDIRITGSHEKVIKRMLKDYEIPERSIFIYYAELIGDIHPSVENKLNNYFVKDLKTLNKVIRDGEFIPNTRMIKYILNYTHYENFKQFIDYQPVRLVSNWYHLAIGNSYHLIPEYSRNLTYMRDTLRQEKLL